MQKDTPQQGIMTGPETDYGQDAIGDTVLRNPIKGYPTMGDCLPDEATMSSPRVCKGMAKIEVRWQSKNMDGRGEVHHSTPLL